MKKLFNLILIAILISSALKAQAQTLSGEQIRKSLSGQITQSYAKYTDAEVEAKILALPFANLTIPDGKVSYMVTPSSEKFMARDLEKVNVYVNDKLVRTFNIPVALNVYKNVLVASTFIERDKELTASVVTPKRMEISNYIDYVVDPQMLQKEMSTKKVFREGEVIDKRFVKFKPDVTRSANVKAYFSADNIVVEVDAIALSDGMTGEYISVQNKNYNKTYTGKVIGVNKVLIEI